MNEKIKYLIEETDHAGRTVYAISRKWKDGTHYRRRHPYEVAKLILARWDIAEATNTWEAFRDELLNPPQAADAPKDYTIGQYADIYWNDYSLSPAITRPKFHRNQLNHIQRLIGDRKLREFTTADVHAFRTLRAKQINQKTGQKGVKNSTVNRTMSVLSGMFDFALKVGKVIEVNPMEEYSALQEDEPRERVMTHDEVDGVIKRALEFDPVATAYFGTLRETGMREMEGLLLQHTQLTFTADGGWAFLQKTKNKKSREVPLSPEAVQWIKSVERIVGNPFVFVRPETMDVMSLTHASEVWRAARKLAGVDWAWIHDLRHYRCTTWLEDGAPAQYVKKWMGHKRIETTMRYAHTSKEGANRIIREIRKKEAERRDDDAKEA
jgi:integrase